MSYPGGTYNSHINNPFNSGFPYNSSPFGGDGDFSTSDSSGFQPPYQTFMPPTNNVAYIPDRATHMNNKALVSMLLGIISIAVFLPAIPAIIIGFMAKKEIKRGKGTGKLMALIGVICGFIGCFSSIAFWLMLSLLLIPLVMLPFIGIVWYFLNS